MIETIGKGHTARLEIALRNTGTSIAFINESESRLIPVVGVGIQTAHQLFEAMLPLMDATCSRYGGIALAHGSEEKTALLVELDRLLREALQSLNWGKLPTDTRKRLEAFRKAYTW